MNYLIHHPCWYLKSIRTIGRRKLESETVADCQAEDRRRAAATAAATTDEFYLIIFTEVACPPLRLGRLMLEMVGP